MKRNPNSRSALRPVTSYAKLRRRGSDDGWVDVEYMVYYDGSQVRAFAYVKANDGSEIPDGEYDVLEGLDERRRRWRKVAGEWKVKWRTRWDKRG